MNAPVICRRHGAEAPVEKAKLRIKKSTAEAFCGEINC